jgi:hypothetical protein
LSDSDSEEPEKAPAPQEPETPKRQSLTPTAEQEPQEPETPKQAPKKEPAPVVEKPIKAPKNKEHINKLTETNKQILETLQSLIKENEQRKQELEQHKQRKEMKKEIRYQMAIKNGTLPTVVVNNEPEKQTYFTRKRVNPNQIA